MSLGARRLTRRHTGGGGDTEPEPTENTISDFTATVASDTAVNLSWTYSGATLANYTLQRNGIVIATLTAGATSYNDTGLTAGTAYTYTLVGNLAGGGMTPVVNRAVTTTGGESEVPTERGWLSGVGTPEQGNGADPAQYFGNWRGSPVEIGATWPATPELWPINPSFSGGSWAGFQGPMSLSIALHTSSNLAEADKFKGWAAEAAGAHDAWWRTLGQNLAQFRQGRGTTFVALFYEFNGDWMGWSVGRNSTEMGHFKTVFERVSGILREELPGVKIQLPAAMSRNVPEEMIPNPSSFDLMGGTIYNAWPASPNGDFALGQLESARVQAQAHGKPIGISEWASSGSGGSSIGGPGGDYPGFMTAMHTYFNQHKGTGPGQLWYETFFNIDGYDLDHQILRSNGSVNPSQPNAANKYKELF